MASEQEQIEVIWRTFGKQEITVVPKEHDRVFCRHFVKKVLSKDYVVVDEPVNAQILTPWDIKVGQCPACSIIYWFRGEIENVVRVDRDTAPDIGGPDALPVYASEEDQSILDAMKRGQAYNESHPVSPLRHRSRRIARGGRRQ